MVPLRVASIIAALTLPLALNEAGNAPIRIPLLCASLGIPHLTAAFAPRARAGFAVGLALGSSLVLTLGLIFDTLLSLIRLFPTRGSTWPWLLSAIAHAVMFGTAWAAKRGIRPPDDRIPINAWLGVSYSIVSILLVHFVGTFHF